MKHLIRRAYSRQRLISWDRDMVRRRAREVETAALAMVVLLLAGLLALSFLMG